MTYVVFDEISKMKSDFRSDDSFPVKTEVGVKFLTSPKVDILYSKMKLLMWNIQKKLVKRSFKITNRRKRSRRFKFPTFKNVYNLWSSWPQLFDGVSFKAIMVIWVQKSGKLTKKGQISKFIKSIKILCQNWAFDISVISPNNKTSLFCLQSKFDYMKFFYHIRLSNMIKKFHVIFFESSFGRNYTIVPNSEFC